MEKLNFIGENFIRVVKDNYFNFKGREGRGEYWWFVLANVVVSIVVSILDSIIGSIGIPAILGTIYSLAVLLPSLGVAARRLHDVNKSGWMLLLCLIPLVNFYVIYLLILQPVDTDNKF